MAPRKPPRICTGPQSPKPVVGSAIPLTTRQYRHLISALRRGAGDLVIWFDGDGLRGEGELQGSDRQGFSILLRSIESAPADTPFAASIILGLPKANEVAACLEGLCLAGATAIMLVPAERSQWKIKPADLERQREKWNGVLMDVAEQCGRWRLPAVDLLKLDDALAQVTAPLLIAQSTEEIAASTLPVAIPQSGNYTLAIGPEGGWSPPELARFKAAGGQGWHLPGVTLTTVAACLLLPALRRWG